MIHRFAVMPLMACAVLAACSGGNKAQQQADAPVEVLPGTVSDSMLAEDRLRSEAEIDRTAARTVTGGEAAEAPDATAAVDEGPDAAPVPPPANTAANPPATPTAQGPAVQGPTVQGPAVQGPAAPGN